MIHAYLFSLSQIHIYASKLVYSTCDDVREIYYENKM